MNINNMRISSRLGLMVVMMGTLSLVLLILYGRSVTGIQDRVTTAFLENQHRLDRHLSENQKWFQKVFSEVQGRYQHQFSDVQHRYQQRIRDHHALSRQKLKDIQVAARSRLVEIQGEYRKRLAANRADLQQRHDRERSAMERKLSAEQSRLARLSIQVLAAGAGDVGTLTNLLLEMRLSEREFLRRHEWQHVDRVRALGDRFKEVLHRLRGEREKNGETDAGQRAEALQRHLDAYLQLFKTLAESRKDRGLGVEDGLRGALETTAIAAEKVVDAFDTRDLQRLIIDMRRIAKNYRLRGRPVYIEQHAQRMVEFRRLLPETGLPNGRKKALTSALRAYEKSFLQGVRENKKNWRMTKKTRADMSQHGQTVEGILQSRHVDGLWRHLVHLRAAERTYLLNGSQQQVQTFERVAARLLKAVADSRIAAGDKKRLTTVVREYQGAFAKLVSEDGRIARLTDALEKAVARIKPEMMKPTGTPAASSTEKNGNGSVAPTARAPSQRSNGAEAGGGSPAVQSLNGNGRHVVNDLAAEVDLDLSFDGVPTIDFKAITAGLNRDLSRLAAFELDAAAVPAAGSVWPWWMVTGLLLLLVVFIARSISRPLSEQVAIARAVAAGDLNVAVSKNHGGEFAVLAEAQQRLVSMLSDLVREVEGGGNRLREASRELGTISNALGGNVKRVSGRVTRVVDVSKNMSAGMGTVLTTAARLSEHMGAVLSTTREMGRGMDTISAAAREVHTSLGTVSRVGETANGSMEEVREAVKRSSGNVGTVASAVDELTTSLGEVRSRCQGAASEARGARENAREAFEVMEKLGASAQEIGKVVAVINSIAEQTNILALNASIEAAGAGEAGKGFAVVANEVKELARQTSEATQMISVQVGEIQGNTTAAENATQQVGTVVERLSGANDEILQAINEQNRTVEEISRSIGQVSRETGTVSGLIDSASAGIGEVSSGVRGISSGIGSVTHTVESVNSGVTVISRSVSEVSDASGKVSDGVNRGVEAAREVVQNMDEVDRTTRDMEKMSRTLEGHARSMTAIAATLEKGLTLFRRR